MRSLPALFIAFLAFFSGCACSHAQAPKEYTYEYPCSTWAEPARVVTNQAVGRADTTLALLSGRIVNYLGTYGSDMIAAKNVASGETFAGAVDAKGQFSLYVPEGQYSAQVMSLDYSPFVVGGLNLHSGRRHQLDVFLHVFLRGANTGTCLYKSKRKLSPKQLDAILARAEARRARLYQQQAKAEASTQPPK